MIKSCWVSFLCDWNKKFFQKREQNFLAGAEKRLYLSELIRKQAAPEKTVPLTWWQREIGCSLNVDCHNACISWKQENRASKEKAGWRGAADPLRGLNSKSGMYNWWISRISLNLVRSIPAVFTTFQDCQVDFLALHVIKLRSSRYRLFMFVDFLLLAERIRSDVL